MLAADGVKTSYLRVLALPLAQSVSDFIAKYETVYVIENNFDGQLNQIIRIEHPEDISHVKSMTLGDGLPMTASWIYENFKEEQEG
jgi:2-oxoglutarate ferredoxin oxidoreductase subunit alpha